MSRMRQVPVMDITQREKAMSRNQPVIHTRPAPPAVCYRAKKTTAAKLHLADAPALLSVIASTFARIFYRNSINIGLPIVECPEAVKGIKAGDTVSVDFSTGIIKNITTGEKFKGEPYPEFMQKIISAGGLVDYIKSQSDNQN